MQCPRCHAVLESDARFCPACGEGLGGKKVLVIGLLAALTVPLWLGLLWWGMRTHYAHTPHTQQADPAKYRVQP